MFLDTSIGNTGINPNMVSRRRAVKAIAVSGTGSLASLGRVAASKGGEKRIGVAYDPQTHEILGPASGQFNPIHDELHGTLRLGDERVQLNQSQPITKSMTDEGDVHVKYQQVTDSNTEGLNELVNVTGFESGGVTGYLRRPSGERIAFALNDRPGNKAQKEMIQSVKNVGRIVGGVR